MDPAVEVRLQAGEAAFGVDDAELLRAIAEHGSVRGAAAALGRSRARALGRLEHLEGEFGPLVERQRGGAGGGGSRLTADARTLLARFDRLRAALAGTAGVPEVVLTGEVVERDGELGVVRTDAGRVRALLADDETPDASRLSPGSKAQVSVRADTVTLQAPDDSPEPGATSARNRFAGTVVGVDSGTAVARVAVDVGAADPLLALVTHESRDRLGLEPGVEVVASFKATATRATSVGP
jgi:molybdate transport system regulatory protein